MNKSMTVMAAAAILLSSSAYAQTVDTKADCNKSADVWRTGQLSNGAAVCARALFSSTFMAFLRLCERRGWP